MSHTEHTFGAPSLGTVSIEIADMTVAMPIKFSAGYRLTENQAKVLDAAYRRQFTNNQNAMAKARSEGKNSTPQPNAAGLLALYMDYEPAVGDTVRQSAMEKLRLDAAWRAWVILETEHNEAIKNGQPPLITKAGKSPVSVRFRAKKDENGKVETTAEDQRIAFVNKFLATPEYAGRVQAQIDLALAERGSKKDTPETVGVGGGDLL